MTDPQRTSHIPSFILYDEMYLRVQKKQLNIQEYVLQKERLEESGAYILRLGAFVQFALDAFPVLYPTYCIPDGKDAKGEHLLELFLHACYDKRFVVGATDFWAEDDNGVQRGMPQWAIRWMQLWRQLPPGVPIGRDEVCALLDLLWNDVMDARGILDRQIDNWLYGKIYGEREF